MSAGIIMLIVVASVVVFVSVLLILKKITMPKFPRTDDFIPKKTVGKPEITQGLSFNDAYIKENPEYVEQVEEQEVEEDPFQKYKNSFKPSKEKTLLEQINELSPQMKILLLDRCLALKDSDKNSKKSWIRITYDWGKRVQFF